MANTLKFGTDGNWAVKKDSALAYNDENNNFKPLPFDFTRDTIGTYVDSDGLIKTAASGEARIDYLGNTNGHLLLEPSRTNLLPYSEDFSNAAWQTFRLTKTSSAGIAPDGTNTAYKIVETTDSGSHLLRDYVAMTNGLKYTASVFAKKGELDSITLQTSSSSRWNPTAGVFNLSNGSITSGSGTIENYGNGWYRCSITGTALETGISAGAEIVTKTSGAGDGTSGLYLWGAQTEQSSHNTSYIKTTSASVTRAADTANGAGNSEVFNDSEGVLFADISALANDSTNRFLGISDGSLSNRVNILYNTTNVLIGQIQGAGSLTADSVNILLNNKSALKYKSGDNQLWVNGFKVDFNTSTSGATVGLNVLDIEAGNGSYDFYGKTKEVRYFNTALTDAELEYETSYRSLSEMVTELNLNTL